MQYHSYLAIACAKKDVTSRSNAWQRSQSLWRAVEWMTCVHLDHQYWLTSFHTWSISAHRWRWRETSCLSCQHLLDL